MNKLSIPAKGINFCLRCFEFHEHKVQVDESHPEKVRVKLTCGDCGDVIFISDDKNTFFEYDDEFEQREVF